MKTKKTAYQKRPKVTYLKIQLPLTSLHYLKCGKGHPLVMVPATISEINNWLSLVQFMSQRFTTYFFELPGHGYSDPFKQHYSSDLVAKTVKDFLDKLKIPKITLMGFSFGGILALKTLERLNDRVDKVILFAPCVSQKALRFSKPKLSVFKSIDKVMRAPSVQNGALKLMHSKKTVDFILMFLKKIGHLETNKDTREKLLRLPPSTLEVLVYQIHEILTVDFKKAGSPYKQPCFFGMSIYDPLLNFNATYDCLKKMFSSLTVERFFFPFHQPPQPFTFQQLNQNYGHFLRVLGQYKP